MLATQHHTAERAGSLWPLHVHRPTMLARQHLAKCCADTGMAFSGSSLQWQVLKEPV